MEAGVAEGSASVSESEQERRASPGGEGSSGPCSGRGALEAGYRRQGERGNADGEGGGGRGSGARPAQQRKREPGSLRRAAPIVRPSCGSSPGAPFLREGYCDPTHPPPPPPRTPTLGSGRRSKF